MSGTTPQAKAMNARQLNPRFCRQIQKSVTSTPARPPKKSEYPPRNEEKDFALYWMYQGTVATLSSAQTYAPRRLLIYLGNQSERSFEKETEFAEIIGPLCCSTASPRIAGSMRQTPELQKTCLGYLAYRVKSGMLSANVALGPIAAVTHWKNITAVGVPSVILVGLLKVGPKPFACTKAQMNSVSPKIGIITVLAMNIQRRVETWRYSSGSWIIMKRKKHSSSADVTGDHNLEALPALETLRSCSTISDAQQVAWRDFAIPNQMTATAPRMNTANLDPRIPNADRHMAGMHTSACPMNTARIASPGFNPLDTEVDDTGGSVP
ncbi:hypothetical protein KC333_g226 [Hortaea werneckii]|nr:hypothetical protein KC333_g226 [Hortaea werneckii]